MKTTITPDTQELRRLSSYHMLEGLVIAAMVHGMFIVGLTALFRFIEPQEIVRKKDRDGTGIIIDRRFFPEPLPGRPRAGRAAVIVPAIPVIVQDMTEAEPETLVIEEPYTGGFGSGEPDETSIGEGMAEGSGGGNGEAEREPEHFTPVEREPVALNKPTPVYPELAMRAGVEGTVYIKMWVGRDGMVKRADVVKSTSAIFDESAVAAAQRWVFSPAVMNNGAVSVWVTVPFRFRLH